MKCKNINRCLFWTIKLKNNYLDHVNMLNKKTIKMSDDQDFWRIYNKILYGSNGAHLGFEKLNSFADACCHRKLYDTAEKYYLKAIQTHSDAISISMLKLAHMYDFCMQNFVEAEKYYLMTVNCDNNHWSTEWKKQIALYHLAKLYERQQKYDMAIKYYILTIDNGYEIAKNDLHNLRKKITKLTLLIIHRRKTNILYSIPKFVLLHILKFIE